MSAHTGESDSHLEASQLSLSLCVSNTPGVCSDFLESLLRKTVVGPGCLQPVDSSAGRELGRARPQGIKSLGLVHIPRPMPWGQ